ncbi:MAG: hypothetical protein JWN93_815 [Hyphomicrobiales bacterium]|nr:hypothetical protein [Hyphomicrobiales bacterium]
MQRAKMQGSQTEDDMNAVRKTLARKTATAAVTALALGGMIAATTTEASAGWRRHHHRGWGAPVAAGVVGALALGAFAAAAAPRGQYYAPQGYYPAAGYDPVQCYVENQPAYDAWGQFAGYQRVRVCQ